MKKIMFYLFLFLSIGIISIPSVHAASATISVTGSKTVVVGNTVKLTITLSSSTPLGAWEFDVKYDSNKLTFVSSTLESSTRSAGYTSSTNLKTKTYTITFKAKSSGTAKVYIANSLVYGYDESKLSTTNGSLSINVITQQQLEASYSSNNDLKTLTVNGYELTPAFYKDTKEYTVELENEVTSIKVEATKADSKASISGTGEYSVSEGDNKITITVTAENGSVKNYVIHAIVKELDPIVITIDEKEYTVVRKTENLNIPSTFVETSTLIDEEEVPAFESSITGYRLLAVKDESGDIYFYIMNDDGTFTKYEEFFFGGITIFIVEPSTSDIPKGYETTKTIMLGDQEITIYTNEDSYPLIYGVNVETGITNWYTYDEEEGTLQRFDNTKVEELSSEKEKLLFLIVVLSGSSLLIMIFLLILCAKVRRTKNKKEELLN